MKKRLLVTRNGEYEEHGKCNGDCCRMFTICGYTYDEIKRKHEAKEDIQDLDKIVDMLVTLTKEEIEAGFEGYAKPYKKLYEDAGITIDKLIGKMFTCKHHNKETSLCNDYENRPALCREFPYSDTTICQHEGCTYRLITPIKKDQQIKELT